MSIEKMPDGEIHLAGDTVETLILALCCLEVLWASYPDVVQRVAHEAGMPQIAPKGAEARMLITALMALKS